MKLLEHLVWLCLEVANYPMLEHLSLVGTRNLYLHLGAARFHCYSDLKAGRYYKSFW